MKLFFKNPFLASGNFLSSADNLFKQLGPRSICRSWSGYKLFDTLIVFLKEVFEKAYFDKKSADDNISMKNYPACRVKCVCTAIWWGWIS